MNTKNDPKDKANNGAVEGGNEDQATTGAEGGTESAGKEEGDGDDADTDATEGGEKTEETKKEEEE